MVVSIGVCSASAFDRVQLPQLGLWSCSSSSNPRGLWPVVTRNHIDWLGGRRSSIKCLASRGSVSRELESMDDASVSNAEDDDDLSHVIKFKMSDFKIHDRVSINLGDRGDELVFEATVNDPRSSLFNTRVVLRRLISTLAKRRGRRAIEVLKRLGRCKLLYHSYSMQVHGYVCSSTTGDSGSFTLVHGYHGNSSLTHRLQQSDWLPTLEATLALDEESVRKVGDDTVGGPAASRHLRLIRILMRDLLIGVNYLHSHGLAHTELRLENLHISPFDRHIKVGILGNASDFHECSSDESKPDGNMDRRKMMIAFDMRCIGFIMAKMVLRELMDPTNFSQFKGFLSKGNDPSCSREFLIRILGRNSSTDKTGIQILDRNWGAGWNLLSLLLASKPSQRISSLDALRHPFLCGPRWRVDPTMDMIRWSLGSTAVRIAEEYIYGKQQRRRIAHFIELMEMLNPHSKPRQWLEYLPGTWRLLYSTGRHIGLSLRQPPARVLIGDVHLTISKLLKPEATFSIASDIGFKVIIGQDWAHDKTGTNGKILTASGSKLRAGRRLYMKEGTPILNLHSATPDVRDSIIEKLASKKWRKIIPIKEYPSSLPVAKLTSSDVEVTMSLDEPLSRDIKTAQHAIREVRMQIPPELFDLSKIVCGTYVDSRLLLLRSVDGSALLFTRSTVNESYS